MCTRPRSAVRSVPLGIVPVFVPLCPCANEPRADTTEQINVAIAFLVSCICVAYRRLNFSHRAGGIVRDRYPSTNLEIQPRCRSSELTSNASLPPCSCWVRFKSVFARVASLWLSASLSLWTLRGVTLVSQCCNVHGYSKEASRTSAVFSGQESRAEHNLADGPQDGVPKRFTVFCPRSAYCVRNTFAREVPMWTLLVMHVPEVKPWLYRIGTQIRHFKIFQLLSRYLLRGAAILRDIGLTMSIARLKRTDQLLLNRHMLIQVGPARSRTTFVLYWALPHI